MVRVRQGVRNTYKPLIEGDPVPDDQPVDIDKLEREIKNLQRLGNLRDLDGKLRGQKVRSV